MRNNTYYYGEIVARIAGKLYSLTNDHVNDNDVSQKRDISFEDMICDISADAGRVFDTLEDLSGEHFIDWPKALDYYSNSLRAFIKTDRRPNMVDMISMAAKSMDVSRGESVAEAKTLL